MICFFLFSLPLSRQHHTFKLENHQVYGTTSVQMQLKTNFNRDRCKMELQSVEKTKPEGKMLSETKKYTKNKANRNENGKHRAENIRYSLATMVIICAQKKKLKSMENLNE